MVYWVAWVLCMGFVLLAHFTWISCGILAVLAIVSLYKNVLREESVAKYVTLRVRYYVIISTLFFLCMLLLQEENGLDPAYIEENLDTILENTYTWIAEYCKEHAGVVAPVGVVAVLLVIVRGKLKEHPFLHTVLEYQFTIVFYSILWAALFHNADFGFVYILYALVFLMGDIVRKVYDDGETLGDKAGKRSFGFFSFLLLVYTVFNPQMAARCQAFDFQTVTALLCRWSVFLFLFLVSLVVLVSIACIETSLVKGYAYEKMMLLTTTSILPVVFVCARSCVRYRWVVLLCYFVYVLIAVTRIAPRALEDTRRYTWTDFLPMPCVSLSMVFLLIEAQYGKVAIAAVLLVSTWLLVLVWQRTGSREKEEKQYMLSLSSAIVWLYINTLSRLWLFHWHISACIVMTVVTILFIAVVYLLHHNPEIYEENDTILFGQFLLPLLYVGIAGSILMSGGSDVELIVEDGYIQVKIETETEHTVAEAKYCWLTDMTEVADDIVHENETEYLPLSENQKIRVQEGLLKIIVEDQEGIRVVKKQWYSSDE